MARRRADINVLIACEESQAECMAFREAGFRAFSADLQLVDNYHRLDWHIPGDCTPLLLGKTTFMTQDGVRHRISRWHMVIAHPPCTYLCKLGAVHMYKGGKVNPVRHALLIQAKEFFMTCLNAKADCVAVENPQPLAMAGLPKPTCYVEPFWYGAPYSKKTLYWTRNLPPLMAGNSAPVYKQFVGASRGKYRSRTFPEIAKALASQWGDYLHAYVNHRKV